MSDNKLKVLIVSSEVMPYAKSGGLGDVVGSLPKELKKNGVDVRIIFPKYQFVNQTYVKNQKYITSFFISLGWRNQGASILSIDSEVPTYMVENDYYFGRDGFYGYGDDYERFAFFTKASIEFLSMIGFRPDIIHFNDWQTGLGPVYLNDVYKKFIFYSNIKSLYTIHNLKYQGLFDRDILWGVDLNDGYYTGGQLEFRSRVSYMKAGVLYSNAVSTVSETYALEIQSDGFGYGMDGVLRCRADDLYGILNGVDYDIYSPEKDSKIFANYNASSFIEGKKKNKSELQKMLNLPVREDVPVISVISRLVDQKGIDIILCAMDELLSRDIQFIILGIGDSHYEHSFRGLQYRCPDKISANIYFSEDSASKVYAGSDVFLMPSLFEPCGLGQMIAMKYGTVPIVRKTGGLADTVRHYDENAKEGNGFVFEHYLSSGLMWAVDRALDMYHSDNWKDIVRNAMNCDFSWKKSAEKYINLYDRLARRNCELQKTNDE